MNQSKTNFVLGFLILIALILASMLLCKWIVLSRIPLWLKIWLGIFAVRIGKGGKKK